MFLLRFASGLVSGFYFCAAPPSTYLAAFGDPRATFHLGSCPGPIGNVATPDRFPDAAVHELHTGAFPEAVAAAPDSDTDRRGGRLGMRAQRAVSFFGGDSQDLAALVFGPISRVRTRSSKGGAKGGAKGRTKARLPSTSPPERRRTHRTKSTWERLVGQLLLAAQSRSGNSKSSEL